MLAKAIDHDSSEKLFEDLPLGECYVRLFTPTHHIYSHRLSQEGQ
jgi:hypothetical protein